MRTFRTIAALAAFSIAIASPAYASGPKGAAKGPKVTTQSPKGGSKAPKGSAQGTKSTSTAAPSSPKSDKATASPKKASTRKDASTTTASSETASTPTSATTSPTPPMAEPNPISTKISAKPEQLARVKAMLPQGMTLEQATAGFKNQGQFLATLNASKNQGLNFADLQKAVTVEGLSVGQAVKKVKSAPAPEGSR